MVVDVVIFNLNDWAYFFHIDAYDKEAVYCKEDDSLDVDDIIRTLIGFRINSYESQYLNLDGWEVEHLDSITDIEKLNWLKSQIK